MNITLKTLTLTVDEKSIPLSRAIVKQIPCDQAARPELFGDETSGYTMIGEVSLSDDQKWLLIGTPAGVRRMDGFERGKINSALYRRGLPPIERLYLLK